VSQENVELVERAIAAINARDLDGYLACCTEDVELHTPMAPVGGVYVGAHGIRQFMIDIEDAAPDFRIDLERAEAIEADRIIASVHTSSTGRTSGIPLDLNTTNVYDFAGGRIKRVRIFSNREQALTAVGLEE
jgi:ketosteroid isomerase-like protein